MSDVRLAKHEVAGPPRQRQRALQREQELVRRCCMQTRAARPADPLAQLAHLAPSAPRGSEGGTCAQMSRQGQADSGRDTVFSSDGSSSCEAGEVEGEGGSPGSSSSGVGSSHTPTAPEPAEPTRPPRITPLSGVLSQGKAVIRPIAFRPLQGGAMSPGPGPLGAGSGGGPWGRGGSGSGSSSGSGRLSNSGERYGSTPVLARPGARLALHGSSTDLRSGGSHLSLDRRVAACSSPLSSLSSVNSLPLPLPQPHGSRGQRAGSVDAARALRRLPLVGLPLGGSGSGSSSHHADLDRLDTSPADLELEAALRGRDSEIAVRQRDWRRLHHSMHAADGRARQRVRERERDREQELRARLEETEWALHQRNGELSLLKAQLKDAHAERAARAQDAMALRGENRELRAQLERVEAERATLRRQLSERDADLARARDARAAAVRDASDLRAVARHLESELELAVAKGTQAVKKHTGVGALAPDAQQLRSDLRRLREELAAERAEFELERATWAEEKEKVLRYQRQLQLNYVQMFRRTRSLEAEVESLTMELELESKAHKKAGKIHSHTIEL